MYYADPIITGYILENEGMVMVLAIASKNYQQKPKENLTRG